MSRTYRRKNTKIGYNNFKNEAEFNRQKALHEAGNPRPEGEAPLSCWCPHLISWNDYYLASRFHIYSYGRQTYKEWKAKSNAVYHSDAGHSNCGFQSVPSFFRNLKGQKPLRVKTRCMMAKALAHDLWDEVIFPEPEDLSWLYF